MHVHVSYVVHVCVCFLKKGASHIPLNKLFTELLNQAPRSFLRSHLITCESIHPTAHGNMHTNMHTHMYTRSLPLHGQCTLIKGKAKAQYHWNQASFSIFHLACSSPGSLATRVLPDIVQCHAHTHTQARIDKEKYQGRETLRQLSVKAWRTTAEFSALRRNRTYIGDIAKEKRAPP